MNEPNPFGADPDGIEWISRVLAESELAEGWEGEREEPSQDLPEALARAAGQVEDAQQRLETARSVAAGEEPETGELDRELVELPRGTGSDESDEEDRRRRARKLARSAAEDLAEALQRLQEILQEDQS